MARYSRTTVRTNTVIVGAGAAGLAVAACLRRRRVPLVILDQDKNIGSAWLKRYERLHLHTHKNHSSLPYLSFPRHYPPYPSRLQFADYLEIYAKKFRLEPRFDERVRSIMRRGDLWSSRAKRSDYVSRNLVIATGYSQKPVVPALKGKTSFTGQILHSSSYKNGEPFSGQNVLVVGCGNSGGEIALDLHEYGAKVSMSIRGPVNVIPRDVFGVSSHRLSVMMRHLPTEMADALSAPLVKMTMGDLTPYGLEGTTKGPLTQIKEEARVPLLDIGTMKLIKEGQISVFKEIDYLQEENVYFMGGAHKSFDAIILATGFKHNVGTFFRDLNQLVDESGNIKSSGTQTELPGVYFCGFHNAPYGFIREIGIEAKQISHLIKQSDTSIPPEEQTVVHEKQND